MPPRDAIIAISSYPESLSMIRTVISVLQFSRTFEFRIFL